jgi:transcription elongation GreA/GreB family factor
VRFGVKVTLGSAGGSRREFRIVGEDEAEPAQGRISWVSPLAVALIGKTLGDMVEFQGQDAEIVRLEA